MKSTLTKPSIVLLPRALAMVPGFSKLIRSPAGRGYECIAPSTRLNSNGRDVALTKATIGRSAAGYPCRPLLWRKRHHRRPGTDDRVVAVYICALAPGADRDFGRRKQSNFPDSGLLPHRR